MPDHGLPAADLLGYALAQVAGGVLGVTLMAWIAGPAMAHPSVDFVATRPGPAGAGVAFAAELAIAFVLFSAVLRVMASPRRAAHTPWVAGALLAAYITFESPLSGTSMNPARTFGSALLARDFRQFGSLGPAHLLQLVPDLPRQLLVDAHQVISFTA